MAPSRHHFQGNSIVAYSIHLALCLLTNFSTAEIGAVRRPSNRHLRPVRSLCPCFQIPLPGGRTVSFNPDTGVLRIDLEPKSPKSGGRPVFPSDGSCPSKMTVRSIEVRDTGTARGHGAFATADLPRHEFIGFYEGETIRTREELDRRLQERQMMSGSNVGTTGGTMDYVMSLDGGVTFLDGYDRAQNQYVFSPVHLNHEDGERRGCNCFRMMDGSKVAFFTSRAVATDEELCFNYGKNFWKGRENLKISQ